MWLYSLSRGAWIVLAVLIGATIAWLHTTLTQATITQSMGQREFMAMLIRAPMKGEDGSEYPWVRSVKISPAIAVTSVQKAASGEVVGRKAPVTYQVLTPVPAKRGWQYQSKATLVDDPIEMYGENPMPLTRCLSGLAQDRPWVKYRYAFWQEPRWTYTLWIGGCVLLMGVVWPTAMRRLTLAGYGGIQPEEARRRWAKPAKHPTQSVWEWLFTRKPKAKKEKPKKKRWSWASDAAAPAGPGGLSEDDLQAVAAMEVGMRPLFTPRTPEEEEAAKPKVEAPKPEPRELTGGVLEEVAPLAEEGPKEYGGEFYPTTTHVKQHADGTEQVEETAKTAEDKPAGEAAKAPAGTQAAAGEKKPEQAGQTGAAKSS